MVPLLSDVFLPFVLALCHFFVKSFAFTVLELPVSFSL